MSIRMPHPLDLADELSELPQRVEVVAPASSEYIGRVAVRRAALALLPQEDIEFSTAKAMRPRAAGPMWKIVSSDGVTIALRARDLPDVHQVRPDIAKLTRRRDELRSVIVEDAETARVSFWILRGRNVVIVGARLLPERRSATVERDARRVMGVLAGIHPERPIDY